MKSTEMAAAAEERIPAMVELAPEQEQELARQLKEAPQRNRTKI